VRETNKGKRFEAFALSACEDLISFMELVTNYMQMRLKVKVFGAEYSTEVRIILPQINTDKKDFWGVFPWRLPY
jgi:hypothetical protein